MIEKRKDGNNFIYKFKGKRMSYDTVVFGSGSSTGIGSVFFVNLFLLNPSSMKMDLFGKPTINGQEVCSKYEIPEYKCTNVTTGAAWAGTGLVQGKEEAEVIQSIILESQNLNMDQ